MEAKANILKILGLKVKKRKHPGLSKYIGNRNDTHWKQE